MPRAAKSKGRARALWPAGGSGPPSSANRSSNSRSSPSFAGFVSPVAAAAPVARPAFFFFFFLGFLAVPSAFASALPRAPSRGRVSLL